MNANDPILLPPGADPTLWFDSDGGGPHGLEQVAGWCGGDPAAAGLFHMFRGPTYARYLELLAVVGAAPRATTRMVG
jgi:hypothetical protein